MKDVEIQAPLQKIVTPVIVGRQTEEMRCFLVSKFLARFRCRRSAGKSPDNAATMQQMTSGFKV